MRLEAWSASCRCSTRAASSEARSTVVLRQRLHGMGMRRLQLRMQRQQVVDGLFHQRVDLRLLRIGGIDLHVEDA